LWIIFLLRVSCRKWESRQCKLHGDNTVVCRGVTAIPRDLPANIKVLDLRLSFVKSYVNLTVLTSYRHLKVVDLRKQLTVFNCGGSPNYRFKVLTDCARNRRYTTAAVTFDDEVTTADDVTVDDFNITSSPETTTNNVEADVRVIETTTTHAKDKAAVKTTTTPPVGSSGFTTPKSRRRYPDANKRTHYQSTPRGRPNPRLVTTNQPPSTTATTMSPVSATSDNLTVTTTSTHRDKTMKWLWLYVSAAITLAAFVMVWFLWWCITTLCFRSKCRRSCARYCRLRRKDSDDPDDDDDTMFQQTPPATEPMSREAAPVETLAMNEYPVMGRWRPLKKQE